MGVVDQVLATVCAVAVLWTLRKVGRAATGMLRTVEALSELAHRRQECYDAARRVERAAARLEKLGGPPGHAPVGA